MLGWLSDGDRLGLGPEPGDEVRVAAVLGPQDLDGDVAAQLAIRGAVDRRHAALSEQLDEPIPTAKNAADLRQTRIPFASTCSVPGAPRPGPARQARPAGIVPHGKTPAGPLGVTLGRVRRRPDQDPD